VSNIFDLIILNINPDSGLLGTHSLRRTTPILG